MPTATRSAGLPMAPAACSRAFLALAVSVAKSWVASCVTPLDACSARTRMERLEEH